MSSKSTWIRTKSKHYNTWNILNNNCVKHTILYYNLTHHCATQHSENTTKTLSWQVCIVNSHTFITLLSYKHSQKINTLSTHFTQSLLITQKSLVNRPKVERLQGRLITNYDIKCKTSCSQINKVSLPKTVQEINGKYSNGGDH